MKKIVAVIQSILFTLALCACSEEVIDIRSLLPEKEIITGQSADRPIYSSAEQLAEVSDCIIEGEVLDDGTVYSASEESAESGSMMYFTVKVLKSIKGDPAADTVIIAQKGGAREDAEVKYKKGEHIISFLYQYEETVPGTEKEYPCYYMSVACEDANFRVVQIEYNGKPVSVVQSFGSENILQYDGRSLSDFLKLLQ